MPPPDCCGFIQTVTESLLATVTAFGLRIRFYMPATVSAGYVLITAFTDTHIHLCLAATGMTMTRPVLTGRYSDCCGADSQFGQRERFVDRNTNAQILTGMARTRIVVKRVVTKRRDADRLDADSRDGDTVTQIAVTRIADTKRERLAQAHLCSAQERRLAPARTPPPAARRHRRRLLGVSKRSDRVATRKRLSGTWRIVGL